MMKKFLAAVLISAMAFAFAQEGSSSKNKKKDQQSVESEKKAEKERRPVTIPSSKKPKEVDAAKAEKAALKDEGKDAVKEKTETLKYGIESEILDMIKKLNDNEDPRFSADLYELFYQTKSVPVRDKIIEYFTKQEDPCIEDYAVEILDDPYDTRNSTVDLLFKYVSAVKTKEAVPAVLNLIESEDEQYFNQALAALGEIGGTDEAGFLIELLDRDDLTVNQRQNLMKVLGKIKALSTLDRITEIAQDEEENSFVRMYAAQAIGEMKDPKSIEILVDLFEGTDPNFRQYVIKGISNYDTPEAKKVIIEGIRDAHWKVRIEAIESASKMKLEEAVEFIIYRAKNDPENVVKDKCYSVLGTFNSQKADDFLIEQIKNEKTADNAKLKSIEALLKQSKNGNGAIKDFALSIAADDKRKPIRYNVGKHLAKYPDPSFEEVCQKYLESKDAQTCALGLDMYASGRYESCEGKVKLIADDKKAGANSTKAKKILKIE